MNEWSVRLKFLLHSIEQGWSPECDNVAAQDGEWGVLKTGCVNHAVFNPRENKRLPASIDPVPEYEVRPGDVLMSRANTTELLGSAAYIRETPQRLLLCDKLYRLTTKPGVLDPRFLAWFLASATARSQLEPEATGTSGSMQNIAQDIVRDLWMPMLPYSRQVAVADFLDREMARLDGLVAAKERVLGLMVEKRRALITRAVTRGLDRSASLRDSGILWLGEIPAHWKIIQLKFVTRSLQTGPFGSQLHAEEYITGGIPVVNPSHLNSGRICADDRVSVDEATAERLVIHQLSPGDVVFARRGELGRCGVVEPSQAGWLCGTGSLRARLRPDMVDPYYLVLVFTETGVSDVLTFESVGTTMDNLNTEILGSCQFGVPPLTEQRGIVAHVAAATAKLDALRSATERTIALLKERRAALIAAAVTGRLHIPEAV